MCVFALLCTLAMGVWAQHVNPEDREVDMDNPTFVPMLKVSKVKQGADSLQYVELNRVYVYPQPEFKSDKQKQAYLRLVYNVKKVLPIAKEVNHVIIETYDYLETLPDKKSREEHMKRVEASLKKEYGPRMKKLSYAQGKLLIKLVYRECNSSGYELIQAFLGPVRAGFYQAFAWAFGASLTKKYDPEKTDRLTERVVRMVESGQL
jgi:isoleucyl-tRNA synthetase